MLQFEKSSGIDQKYQTFGIQGTRNNQYFCTNFHENIANCEFHTL